MSWGTELWDRCESVFAYTYNGLEVLENDFAEYIKERSLIEADYAKKLKNLSNDYSVKISSEENPDNLNSLKPSVRPRTRSRVTSRIRKNKEDPNKEKEVEYYNLIGEYRRFFKRLLEELWCVASKHEVFSESLLNETWKGIQEQVKTYKEIHKRKVDEHRQHSLELTQAYPVMEKAKEKFKKAFGEKEKSIEAYNTVNSGGSNRKELNKLNQQVQEKTSSYDSTKGEYANQMLVMNEVRSKFYGNFQPSILNELQEMEEGRIGFLKKSIEGLLSKQRETSVSITNHCNSLTESIQSIDPKSVTSLFQEMSRSGDVPPSEFNFENMNDGQALVLQDVVEESKASNLNLYPKKRKMEVQISKVNASLLERRMELEGLQKMQQTNQKDSDNGQNKPKMNMKEIASQIDSQMSEILELENQSMSLKQKISDINNQLIGLRRVRPYPGSVAYEEIDGENRALLDAKDSNNTVQESDLDKASRMENHDGENPSTTSHQNIRTKVLKLQETLDLENIPPPDI